MEKVFKTLALCVSRDVSRGERILTVHIEQDGPDTVRMYATSGHCALLFDKINYEELQVNYRKYYGYDLPDKITDGMIHVDNKMRKQMESAWFIPYDLENPESLNLEAVRADYNSLIKSGEIYISFELTSIVQKVFKLLNDPRRALFFDRWGGNQDPVEFDLPEPLNGILIVMPMRRDDPW